MKFRRLPLLLSAALALFTLSTSCSAPAWQRESLQQSESLPTIICHVHGAGLETVLVPVEHGCLGPTLSGYDAARAARFPHAVVPQRAGGVHEITLERHCRKCTYAELDWLFEAYQGEIVTDGDAKMPTFYELPEGDTLGQG
ncbi:MAG: hypothetical protein ACT4PU_01170 [Planctomycetota bacterium]